jgi:formylglycine-generating enzyme required for sulfatase activity
MTARRNIFRRALMTLPALLVLVAPFEARSEIPRWFEPLPLEEELLMRAAGEGMVFVKGGCFQMGDIFDDGKRDERPVHEVCVSDFYMGRYEVTQREWRDVMGTNPSYFKGDERPVESVNWEDVQDFIATLNAKTAGNYRLPTEAEWEYAARSGGKRERLAGAADEGVIDQYAWYVLNAMKQTHEVGRKAPNGLGLYDMSGNVWEWTFDWYGKKYYKKSIKDNPAGPPKGKYRVLRGGGSFFKPWFLRTVERWFHHPLKRHFYFGFRLSQSAR